MAQAKTKSTKKTTKKKATKKTTPKKSPKLSNKDQVYLAWKDGEEDVEKLHTKVGKSVKQSTIKGWLSRWGRKKGLPRVAKANDK